MTIGFGSPLDLLTEGLLDAVIGIITDGFLVEEEEEEIVPQPPLGGSIPPPPRFIFFDIKRIRRVRDDRDLIELIGGIW